MMDVREMSMDEMRSRMLPEAVSAVDDYSSADLGMDRLLETGIDLVEKCPFSAAMIFNRLMLDYPANPAIVYEAARGFYNIEDYGSATAAFRTVCSIAPEKGLNHYMYALSLMEVGNYPEAHEQLECALQLESSSQMYRLASVFYEKKAGMLEAQGEHELSGKAHEEAVNYAYAAYGSAATPEEKAEAQEWQAMLKPQDKKPKLLPSPEELSLAG